MNEKKPRVEKTHATVPLKLEGKYRYRTWTISLTPGVRRRVAPIAVVMASWMDSREYTFLIKPAVQKGPDVWLGG